MSYSVIAENAVLTRATTRYCYRDIADDCGPFLVVSGVPIVPNRAAKLVLIADDFAEAADTLGLLIEEFVGVEPLIARNGREAVDRALAQRPDIAVLDIDMPVLDGIEAAREIREKLGDKRPMLIAHSGGVNAERATRSRMFDYVLTKPTSLDRLLQLLAGDP